MTLAGPDNFIKMTELVYVIKDTVGSTVFAKIDMKQHKNTCLFKLPPVSLKQIEKFLHFSFKYVGNFSNSKHRPAGQRKLGENPTPGAMRACESPGVAWGFNQAWNWLMHNSPCFRHCWETNFEILLIAAIRYCRRNARFPVHTSPHRKFQKCDRSCFDPTWWNYKLQM